MTADDDDSCATARPRAGGPDRLRHPQHARAWRPHALSAGALARLPPALRPAALRRLLLPQGQPQRRPQRLLAAQRRPARLEPGLYAVAAPRRLGYLLRHPQQPHHHPQPAARLRRGAGQRDQRLADRRVAGAGAAPARLDGGALRRQRPGGGGDPPPGRRPALCAGAADGAHQRAAGQVPLLEALRGRRRARSADRHPLRRRRRPPLHRRWLAVLLHRGPRRHGPELPVAADQPGLRGRLRAVPDAQGGADRGRLRLAAGAEVAAGPQLARACATRCRTCGRCRRSISTSTSG